MKEKKSFNLITLIVIGTISILIVLIGIIYLKQPRSQNTGNQITNENLEENDKTQIEEFALESENIEGENIAIDSELGKLVCDYFLKIYADDGALSDQILEFNNIENAPKEYLHACVVSEVLRQWAEKENEALLKGDNKNYYKYDYINDIFENRSKDGKNGISYEEYNEVLVKLFGKKANGLIDQKYLDEVFSTKYENGRYKVSGYCGAEWNYFVNFTKNIEKRDDIIYVEMYEYRTDYGEEYNQVWENLGTKNYENFIDYNEYLYNRSGDLITTIKHKFSLEETLKINNNHPVYEEYYEDGTKISDSDQSFIDRFSQQLSVRVMEIKYNEKDNSLYLLRNKLITD